MTHSNLHRKRWQFFGLLFAKALLLTLALAPASSKASLPHHHDNDVLRVAAPARERVFARLSPYGEGFEPDLVERFARTYGYRIEWLSAADRAEALDMLRRNRADLAVGFTEAPCADDAIASGPSYAHERPVEVRARHADGREPEVLRDEYEAPVMRQVAFTPDAEGLHATGAPARAAAMPDRQEGVALPATAHETPTIIDGASWALWQPFVHTESRAATLESPLTYRWHWRAGAPRLDANLRGFWQARQHPVDTMLDDLTEQYFGFLPETLDPYDLKELSDTVEDRVPRYGRTIAKAASKAGLDPLLLTAVIFQESRFNPNARSHTGVRGIMQLTQETAIDLKVNRMDPDQSIRGGARYLRMIWDSLEELNLDPWDRWFFTLAGFNQGPGHLRDAIRLSQELGGSGRTWRELKEVFPKLARAKYYTRARYGYCRGYEAVDFVESVRWYYYVLSGLVVLDRPEAKHLAPLLAVRGTPVAPFI